jgi:hypothetical protein
MWTDLVQCEILWFASAFMMVVLCLWDFLAYVCAPMHFVLLVHGRFLLANTICLHRNDTITPPLSPSGRRHQGLTRILPRKTTSNMRASTSSKPANCPEPEASGVRPSPVPKWRHASKANLWSRGSRRTQDRFKRSHGSRRRQLRFKKAIVWRMHNDRRPSIRPSNMASGLMCLSLMSVYAWGIPARINLPQHNGHSHLDARDSTVDARYDGFG